MHPFFTFFGGKWRAAPHYPAPRHDLLVEPFAGSAGYALRYPERSVILCEADATMRGVWAWLLTATPDDLRGLPDVPAGKTVDDFGLPQGARDFVGLWMNKGMTGPCVTPSPWLLLGIRPKSSWGQTLRDRLAAQLPQIRHWTLLDDYRKAPDAEATWFIDPPYQGRLGRRYRAKITSYEALGEWCRSRLGQVIVCENEGADWLPFRPFRTIKGTEGKGRTGVSHETIWTNDEQAAAQPAQREESSKMATRKKKSDLATVTTKLVGQKASPTQAVFDAQFVKTAEVKAEVTQPVNQASLPGLGELLGEPDGDVFNVRTGTVVAAPVDGLNAPQTPAVVGAPQAAAAVVSSRPAPSKSTSKYAAFTHVQANVKGGIDVALAPCTAIVGPNRTKKTAVLDAIKLAVLGTHPDVADRPTDLLAFASTGSDNLTATITSPQGTMTTMLADEPGFKRPTHEATGELNELLAVIDAKACVPTVAIGELMSFGETRMREAVFKRFGTGVSAVKMPDGLSDEQKELWLSTEKLLRSEGTEPTYAVLAEKFRQLKLEAGRQVKRSEESAEKARAELGDAALMPKDKAEKLHADLERLTREGAALAAASRQHGEYQADKANFIRAFEALPEVEQEGAEPAFGVVTGAVDLAPLRKALEEASMLAEQDAHLLLGLNRIVAVAEKTGACPCCRTAGDEVVDKIRKTYVSITVRYEQRLRVANDATIALTDAVQQNEQRVKNTTESPEHAAWRAKHDTRLSVEKKRVELMQIKEGLLARKAALPPEPSLQALADADQALNAVREELKKITMQAGQVAVLESFETEARKAKNHKAGFQVLEGEAKTALQKVLEQVRVAALACVNRYVPAGWEVKLTLDDGACKWEIVGADGAAHGKGVASGSEWTTLTLALACAWTEGSPLRVLLIDDDDLGKFSPDSLRAFLDRVHEVVEGGWLTQAVIAWTRPDEIPSSWVKVQR